MTVGIKISQEMIESLPSIALAELSPVEISDIVINLFGNPLDGDNDDRFKKGLMGERMFQTFFVRS